MFFEIQVSEATCFPQKRWREAILFYLFGLWANKDIVTYRPKITFGTITLSLDGPRKEYYSYGINQEKVAPTFLGKASCWVLVGPNQEEVEVGLVRFVKNDQIRQLAIASTDSGTIWLWKTTKRGEYGIWGSGIPSSMEECIEWDARMGRT